MNPCAGNLARVAGSSCGTGRCVGLIRARGAWTHRVCGCRRRSQGAAVGAGSRALPSPAVLGLPRGHCWCARPQDSLLGAGSGHVAPQAVPPSSLPPCQVRWHCLGGACGCGGHFPHSSPFQPVHCKPGAVGGCVPGFAGASILGMCEGAGRWVLLLLSGCGAARTP